MLQQVLELVLRLSVLLLFSLEVGLQLGCECLGRLLLLPKVTQVVHELPLKLGLLVLALSLWVTLQLVAAVLIV